MVGLYENKMLFVKFNHYSQAIGMHTPIYL